MRRRTTTTLLAGWLFADSLLGLTFVALGSEPETPAPVKVAATAKPIPTPTPRPTPSVRATPKPRVSTVPAGVEQRPVVVHLPAGPLSAAAIRFLFANPMRANRRAAFVLTFGVAAEPGAGVDLAKTANARLLSAAPRLFSGSAQRNFWQAVDGQHPTSGAVDVELYLFTQPTGAH
jgi:hypothetical protein